MNKKANRRAFFVCSLICIMYISVAARIPDKVRFGRIPEGPGTMRQSINASIPGSAIDLSAEDHIPGDRASKTKGEDEPTGQQMPVSDPPPAASPAPHATYKDDTMEPSIFMSVPMVCYAIQEGLIEKEGLIFTKKEGYNDVTCKKAIDILKDRDEQGLRSISKIIGKKIHFDFLKKEGITYKEGLTAEDIMLGRGFVVEKRKLLSMYDRHVSSGYDRLFPFMYKGLSIVQAAHGFELMNTKDIPGARLTKEDGEWLMPDLINLPMRTAVEKIAVHTAKIRIYGSGDVVDQQPRPLEKIQGETECSIYGRTSRQ